MKDSWCSLREKYVKNFYEEVIPDSYDRMVLLPEIKAFWEKEDRIIASAIPNRSSVLDVGCGTGRHLSFLKRKGCKVTGLDYSKKMLQLAGGKVKDIEFILADMREIPLKDDYIDYCICMFSTLGNLDIGRDQAIREMMRVSKKGIIFSIYKKSAKQKIKEWYKTVGFHLASANGDTLRLKEGLSSHFFTEREVEKLTENYKTEITKDELGYVIQLKPNNLLQ